MAFAQDHTHIIVARGDGTQPVALPGTDHVFDFDWAPNSQTLAFTAGIDSARQLQRINRDGTNHQVLVVTANTAEPQWPPDGTTIAFLSNRTGAWDLVLMDATQHTEQRLTHLQEYAAISSIQWSPDGQFVLFVSNHGHLGENTFSTSSVTEETYVVDRTETRVERLTAGGGVLPYWCGT